MDEEKLKKNMPLLAAAGAGILVLLYILTGGGKKKTNTSAADQVVDAYPFAGTYPLPNADGSGASGSPSPAPVPAPLPGGLPSGEGSPHPAPVPPLPRPPPKPGQRSGEGNPPLPGWLPWPGGYGEHQPPGIGGGPQPVPIGVPPGGKFDPWRAYRARRRAYHWRNYRHPAPGPVPPGPAPTGVGGEGDDPYGHRADMLAFLNSNSHMDVFGGL